MQTTPFQSVVERLTRDQTPRVWSLLISVFGDLAQDPGARVSGSLLRRITEQIGIKPEAMRVAIHRLRKDGWIGSERMGRNSVYFLTPTGLAQTTQASPRIYASGQPAERAWFVMSNPAQPTATEDRPGVWITSNVLITASAPDRGQVFVTPIENGMALPPWMSARICDDATVGMSQEFAAALEDIGPSLDAAPGLSTLEIAATRVLLVHGWRRIVLKAPVLPDHVFPEDWRGPFCRARVAELLARYPRPHLDALEAAIA